MSEQFIDVPITTDPEVLAQLAFDYLQANIPDWVPNDANLETILIEASALMAAEARDVASTVPTEIFRYFGELVGILPQEATRATSTTEWTMIDNQGYTIPAGTQIGIRTAGDVLIPFEVMEDVVILPGATIASNVEILATETGIEGSGLPDTSVVELIDTLDFVTTITLETLTTGGVDAEDDDVYLNRLVARLQMLAPRPILARDFAVFAQDIAGVDRAIAVDGYNPFHNKLNANQSSLETDASGWEAETNCAVSRQTTVAEDGIASLRLRSTAGGNMSGMTTRTGVNPVTGIPGEFWSAIADFRSAVSARTCKVFIHWINGADAIISSISSAGAADTTSGWTQQTISGIAPAGTVKVVVAVQVLATGGASEDHFVDKIQLRKGPGTDWVIGGTIETGNERMVAVAAVDITGEAVSAGIKTDVDAYLQSMREVNFIVNMMDPTYTTIDVTFTAVALDGWLPADVEAGAEQAMIDYLSPMNWGLPDVVSFGDNPSPMWLNKPILRYLELAQVLNNVGGLDYITALTFRRGADAFAQTDLALAGAIPLPRAGVITGTVT
jgi:hypothetical protein